MFRTADAFGVEHLYLAGMTGTPDTELNRARIHKIALGAEATVPWTKVEAASTVIEQLKRDDFIILALEQTPYSIDLFLIPNSRFQIPQRIALLVGHELYGVAERSLEGIDHAVEIPMLGQKESLNVSVAFGIALSVLRHGMP